MAARGEDTRRAGALRNCGNTECVCVCVCEGERETEIS